MMKNTNRDWDTWEFVDADEVAVVVYPCEEEESIIWSGFVIAVKGDDWGMFTRCSYGCGLKQSIIYLNGDWNHDDGADEFIVWPRLRSLIPEWFAEECASTKKLHVLAGNSLVFNRFVPTHFEKKWSRRNVHLSPAAVFQSRFQKLYQNRNRPAASEIREMFYDMVTTLPPGREIFKWGLGGLGCAMAEAVRKRDWVSLMEPIDTAQRWMRSIEDLGLSCPVRGLDAICEHQRIFAVIHDRWWAETCRLEDLHRKFSKRRRDKPNFFAMVDAVGKLGKIQNQN
jgi:hypothetical protein